MRGIMNDRIDRLLKLQAMDVDLGELERRLREIPEGERRAQDRLKRKEAEAAQGSEGLKRTRESSRLMELDLAIREQKAQKLKSQRLQIRDNKEYDALSREIQHELDEASRIENRVIEALEDIDRVKARREALDREILADREALDRERARLAAELVDVEREAANARKDREEIASTIDEEDLKQYSRLAKRYRGEAVASVMDQACTGCRLRLSAQVVSNLLMRREMVFCPGCARILYLGDAITAEEV